MACPPCPRSRRQYPRTHDFTPKRDPLKDLPRLARTKSLPASVARPWPSSLLSGLPLIPSAEVHTLTNTCPGALPRALLGCAGLGMGVGDHQGGPGATDRRRG